jgi:VWFA-related protein
MSDRKLRQCGRQIVLLCLVLLTARLSGQSAPAAEQRPTFQSTVRLVQVSVVVHEKNGQPVGDLAAGDFQLYEDGKEQPIQLFSVETDRVTPATTLATPESLPPNLFSNRLEGRAGGGVTVLLFDRLNTRFEDQVLARGQILKFLAGIQPTDRVALYVLESDVVRVLHDFTTDARRLVRMLARYSGTTSIELAASEASAPDFARTGDAAFDAETAAWLQATTEQIAAIYTRRRAESTTDALEAIANHLAGIRGRKNLIWVSSGFPLVTYDRGSPQTMTPEINRATRAVNNANIAVYPVDARGLIGAFVGTPGAQAPVFSTLASTQPNIDTMQTMAEATGGRAYFNTNAIGDAVRRAIDDSRVSYVLGYYPSHANWDGKFREIKVRVNRSGLDVRHRKGYLALPPQPRQGTTGRAEALGDAMRSPLEATGIGMTAQIDRVEGRPSGEVTLVVRVDAASVTFEKRAAMWEGTIDILIAQSLPGGQFSKSMDTSVSLSATDERHDQMLKEGFTLTSKVMLRDQAYRLHVVVRNVPTRTTGSLIIPAEKIRAAIR